MIGYKSRTLHCRTLSTIQFCFSFKALCYFSGYASCVKDDKPVKGAKVQGESALSPTEVSEQALRCPHSSGYQSPVRLGWSCNLSLGYDSFQTVRCALAKFSSQRSIVFYLCLPWNLTEECSSSFALAVGRGGGLLSQLGQNRPLMAVPGSCLATLLRVRWRWLLAGFFVAQDVPFKLKGHPSSSCF